MSQPQTTGDGMSAQGAGRAAAPGEPYCGNCGYILKGLSDSSKCPECGKPLVEVLTRRGLGYLGKRYRSKASMFGLPVANVAFGPHQDGPRGHARGIIAIGDIATGWLAIGGVARGIVAVGGLAIGVFALGGGAVGLLAATGGGAVALGAATGGLAVGSIAVGGGAAGIAAQGGAAFGRFTHDYRNFTAPGSVPAIFSRLSWFFGPARLSPVSSWLPMAVLSGVTLIFAALISLIAMWRLARDPDN